MTDWVGYKWLQNRYGINPVQGLVVESSLGSTRRSVHIDGVRQEIYPAHMNPGDALSAHLTFALKHEGIHLEFLSRLFDRVAQNELVAWINSERTGQYSRRVGFLWEWLKGRELVGVAPSTMGNYVDALDPNDFFVASNPQNNTRWRVRDNLPGNRHFCPIIRRTDAVRLAEQYDCERRLDDLQAEYGTDILMRSAVWLTVKESRASFQIEHEQDQEDRIQRFAAAMERRCGEAENPFDRGFLQDLQREVIGTRTTFQHFGLRQSPVFVGEVASYREVVHYIAPHARDLENLLSGLEAFLEKTKGNSPIVRAAVASFGFVYIHPLIDGNGRVHRFLINDILRRDGAVPKPYILPVSATITHKPQDRARYDEILEVVSRPLMEHFNGAWHFSTNDTDYPDGISSNFEFSGYDQALLVWQYIDFTHHVEYMGDLIENTISQEMREEARFLQSWDAARSTVKELIEGPDRDIDRIIRSVQSNGGEISNKLAKEFPVLAKEGVATQVVQAIANAFPKERTAARKPQ